jgi:hypothetical protein
MFSDARMSQPELIGWTLDNRPLEATAGTGASRQPRDRSGDADV